MGWLRAAIVPIVWLIGSRVGIARADAPVKIAAVPDGPIRLTVGDGDSELRRSFRLVPQGVEQVKIDRVRLVDCLDAHGQSCRASVEPRECAGPDGCTVTATDPGAVTVVVALPTPGTYTSSLEIIYVKDNKPAAGSPVPAGRAVLATTLEVTRPAATAQPMKVTFAGGTTAEIDLGFPRRGDAVLRLRAQDDDGTTRKLAQVVPEPLVRRSGNDSVSTDADIQVFTQLVDKRQPLAAGAGLELPQDGAIVEVEVSGLDQPGRYDGKLRLLAPGHTPLELTYTVTVRDGVWWASAMIAIGALLSYGVQWWVGKRRARLVQQRDLERLRDRLRDAVQRGGLADRVRRLIDALLREADDKLATVEDGDALVTEALARFARRVELTDGLIKTGEDVEALPLAARGEPRKQLDAAAIALADREVEDARLKEIEATFVALASTGVRRNALGELLAALDAAVAQARGALPSTLQPRLTAEVEPALRDAHTAADRDQIDDLDRALAVGRRALARVQGAALAERLPSNPPRIFNDVVGYVELRDEITEKLTALNAAADADTAVRLYEEALGRLAPALCDATARWCRAQKAGRPAEVQARLDELAQEADTARARSPTEILTIIDRVTHNADDAVAGPQPMPTGARSLSSGLRSALAAIPRLAPLAGGSRPVRTRRLIVIGDGVVLLAVTLVAVATGLKLLWVGSPTWGGWNDWLTAILWGGGLHAVGNDTFKGLLGLTRDLGKTG